MRHGIFHPVIRFGLYAAAIMLFMAQARPSHGAEPVRLAGVTSVTLTAADVTYDERFDSNQTLPLLSVSLKHGGAVGEAAVELTTLTLRLEAQAGQPLSVPQAQALLAEVDVYRDTPNYYKDHYDSHDTLLTTASLGLLQNGQLRLALPGGNFNARVAPGETGLFFIVARTSSDARQQSPNHFLATLLASSGGMVREAISGLPVTAAAPDTSTRLLTARLPRPAEAAGWRWDVRPDPTGLRQLRAHTVVWTGKKALIWGGLDVADQATDDGWIFDPESRKFSPMSKVGAPSPRYDHTAVWTGSRMIVWGGQYWKQPGTSTYDYTAYNDGASYDPETDSWTPLSQGKVSGRAKQSAVWTGSRMIVWGGMVYTDPVYDNCALYDSLNDQWTLNPYQIGMQNLKVFGSTAVWTGSQMLVWGGFFGSLSWQSNTAVASQGAALDMSGQWHALASSPLAGRCYHSAVWTGTKMLITGGMDNKAYLTGAYYDPTTDQWTQPDLSAFDDRSEAILVSTGREAIYWGGANIDALQKVKHGPWGDGFHLDYATGDVCSTTNQGAPSPRWGQQAVWMGDQYGMFLYGGVDADSKAPRTYAIYKYDPDGLTPMANFSANQTQGAGSLSVQFYDRTQYQPNQWAWDFENDGIIDSTEPNPLHIYDHPGTYTVHLTVHNAQGSNEMTRAGFIQVFASPPVVDFGATPTTGTVPLTVQFKDLSAGAPVAWSWDCDGDDASDSTTPNPVFIYDSPGLYRVRLTASNKLGTGEKTREACIRVDDGGQGEVYRVDPNSAGTEDGHSWDRAFRTIQAGIDAAATAGGGQLWVAAGRYQELVTMKNNVRVYGGFSGLVGERETELNQRDLVINTTTIDAQHKGHVVTWTNTIGGRLDGLTVTGGKSRQGAGIFGQNLDASNILANCNVNNNRSETAKGESGPTQGGGIFLYKASPLVSHCRVWANNVWYPQSIINTDVPMDGAGICCIESRAIIKDCSVIDNTLGSQDFRGFKGTGAGISCQSSTMTLLRCTICRQNPGRLYNGGGIGGLNSSVNINHCTINDNYNSAIYLSSCVGSITDCILKGNHGAYYSGIRLVSNKGLIRISRCRLQNNIDSGILASNPTLIEDSIISGSGGGTPISPAIECGVGTLIRGCEVSQNKGDGIEAQGSPVKDVYSPAIINCRIINNKECGMVSSGFVSVSGSLIAGNGSSGIKSNYLVVDNCTISGNANSGTGSGIDCGNASIINSIFDGNHGLAINANWVYASYCLFGAHPAGIASLYLNNKTTIIPTAAQLNINNSKGNRDGDPLFVDKVTGDFHLSQGSSAIDSCPFDGKDQWAPALDLDHRPRLVDVPTLGNDQLTSALDAGVYEFQPGRHLAVRAGAQTAGTQPLGAGPLDFGTWRVDAGTTGPLTVTLTNSGTETLNFIGAGLQLIGPNAAEFHLSGPLDITPLAPGVSRVIQLSFSPIAPGAKEAALLITTDDPDHPALTVPLVGTATGCTVNFAVTAIDASETSGAVAVRVALSEPAGAQGVTVQYAVEGGTATAGQDYQLPATGSVHWNAGETTVTLPVTITDDSIDEYDETAPLVLTGATGASLGVNRRCVLRIADDDAAPTVGFAQVTNAATEAATTATLIVNLRGPATARPVLVDYLTTGGAARPGVDYVPTSGTLVIQPPATSGAIKVRLLDDLDPDGPQGLAVQLQNPTNATAGLTSATLQIADDEVAGFGTVQIDTTPEGAPWSLSDGAGATHAGTGDSTLHDITAGTITLTWGEVTGYTPPQPNPDRQTLEANNQVIFTGDWRRQNATASPWWLME